MTWPTYIVLSVYFYLRLQMDIHWTGSIPIEHKVNLIQLKTFELELDFAIYRLQYTDVRIADLNWAPIYHLPGNVIPATVETVENYYRIVYNMHAKHEQVRIFVIVRMLCENLTTFRQFHIALAKLRLLSLIRLMYLPIVPYYLQTNRLRVVSDIETYFLINVHVYCTQW